MSEVQKTQRAYYIHSGMRRHAPALTTAGGLHQSWAVDEVKVTRPAPCFRSQTRGFTHYCMLRTRDITSGPVSVARSVASTPAARVARRRGDPGAPPEAKKKGDTCANKYARKQSNKVRLNAPRTTKRRVSGSEPNSLLFCCRRTAPDKQIDGGEPQTGAQQNNLTKNSVSKPFFAYIRTVNQKGRNIVFGPAAERGTRP